MTKFIYGIKNCHRCALREACNLKNDPKTLIEKPITIEHVNRSTTRHGIKPLPKIQSFCKNFRIEEKTFSPPTTKKELTINPVEETPALLTTPFNTVKKDVDK